GTNPWSTTSTALMALSRWSPSRGDHHLAPMRFGPHHELVGEYRRTRPNQSVVDAAGETRGPRVSSAQHIEGQTRMTQFSDVQAVRAEQGPQCFGGEGP